MVTAASKMEVSSNIRQHAAVINSKTYGCGVGLAVEAAEVAKMCKIPENEVVYETVGHSPAYKRSTSQPEAFAQFGPRYMNSRQHQHWYHVGQNYQHAAAVIARGTGAAAAAPEFHLELKQQLHEMESDGSMLSSLGSSVLQPSSSSGTPSCSTISSEDAGSLVCIRSCSSSGSPGQLQDESCTSSPMSAASGCFAM